METTAVATNTVVSFKSDRGAVVVDLVRDAGCGSLAELHRQLLGAVDDASPLPYDLFVSALVEAERRHLEETGVPLWALDSSGVSGRFAEALADQVGGSSMLTEEASEVFYRTLTRMRSDSRHRFGPFSLTCGSYIDGLSSGTEERFYDWLVEYPTVFGDLPTVDALRSCGLALVGGYGYDEYRVVDSVGKVAPVEFWKAVEAVDATSMCVASAAADFADRIDDIDESWSVPSAPPVGASASEWSSFAAEAAAYAQHLEDVENLHLLADAYRNHVCPWDREGRWAHYDTDEGVLSFF